MQWHCWYSRSLSKAAENILCRNPLVFLTPAKTPAIEAEKEKQFGGTGVFLKGIAVAAPNVFV
jgi:hypothetical protein